MNNIQMTKHHIITTTNEIDTYYTFLPTVYRMYKKHLPDCVFVLGVIISALYFPSIQISTQVFKQKQPECI